jgi:photosystem II stability/assembly factor-like uncharacterized protein
MKMSSALRYALFVVTALLTGSIFAAPALPAPFLLQRGVIADASRGVAYIAAPSKTLDAVDLASGRTLWSSTEAALPIGGNGTYVVGQVEDATAPGTLKLAVLDAVTGRKVSAASVTLPTGASALVADGLTSQFRAVADPQGALFLVSWSYQNAEDDEVGEDPVLQFFAGSFLVSTDGRVTAASGGPVAQLPDKQAGYGAYPAPPWRAGNVTARVVADDHAAFVLKRTDTGSGRPLPDVSVSQRAAVAVPSADQRHFAVVETIGATDTDWVKYRLHIFTTDTADSVTQFVRDISVTPFVVSGDNIAMISPANSTNRKSATSSNPLSIAGMRLSSGFQQWSAALRVLDFTGPRPPQRGEVKTTTAARGPIRVITDTLPPGGTWTAQGPAPIINGQVEGIPNKPVAGAVNSIVARPSDANTVWIATVNGGIWKTTNALNSSPTWVPLTDNLSSLSTGYLSFDTTDTYGQTLVAAAGASSNFGVDLVTPANGPLGGLIKTTDGTHFTALASGGITGKNISGVLARGSTIFVSTWGDPPPPTGDLSSGFKCGGGLFRSTNGGTGFSQVFGPGTVYDVKGSPDPSQSGVVYIASHDCTGSNSGIYKTTDGGASWFSVGTSQMNAALADGNANNAKIAVSGTNVAVGIINSGRLDSLWVSTNSGTSWWQLDTPPSLIPGAQGRLNFSIALDPSSSNPIVYVGGDHQPDPNTIGATDPGTGRLFRVDGGYAPNYQAKTLTHCQSCTPQSTTSNSAPHADSRFLAVDASGRLLEADDGGVYVRTYPTGAAVGDWYSLNGNLQITEPHSVAWDHLSHMAITGNQDNGVTEQPGFGSLQWNSIIQNNMTGPGDGGCVAVNNTSSTTTSARWSSGPYLGVTLTERIMSATGFQTYWPYTPPLTPSGGGRTPIWPFYTTMVPNRVDATHMLFVASNDVFETHDEGSTIAAIGLSGTPVTAVYGSSDSLDSLYAISSAGYGRLYVRTSGTAALTDISTKGPWTPGTSGVTVFKDITSDLNNSLRAYVLTTEMVSGVTFQKIYGTTDGGQNWTNVTGNLSGITDMRKIVFIPGSPSRIAVAGLYGVYQMAIDAAGTWAQLGSGLPNAVVYDLKYDLADDTLIAAEMGRGVWTLGSVGGSPTTHPAAPTEVHATGTTSTLVHVQWTQSLGASSYKIYRNGGTGYSLVGAANQLATTYDDYGVTASNAYLYYVVAVSPGGESPASNIDLATTVIFSHPVAPTGIMKSSDFTETLTAVNAVRRLADPAGTTYPAVAFASPVPALNVAVLAAHLRTLRNALDPALTSLNLPAINYTDPTITSGATPIKAIHISQIQTAIQ